MRNPFLKPCIRGISLSSSDIVLNGNGFIERRTDGGLGNKHLQEPIYSKNMGVRTRSVRLLLKSISTVYSSNLKNTPIYNLGLLLLAIACSEGGIIGFIILHYNWQYIAEYQFITIFVLRPLISSLLSFFGAVHCIYDWFVLGHASYQNLFQRTHLFVTVNM